VRILSTLTPHTPPPAPSPPSRPTHPRFLVLRVSAIGSGQTSSALFTVATGGEQGAATKKKAIVVKLLVACRGDEPTFVVRTLLGNLRTGAVGRTLQTALAHAFVEYLGCGTDPAVAADQLKLCYSQHPNWEAIVVALLRVGFNGLSAACAPQPGVPLLPMLAKVRPYPSSNLPESAFLSTVLYCRVV
jgi:ATP-dependent DNA ligase